MSGKSVKAKKAAFGTPHLPSTGTEVGRMRQVWSQVIAAVTEIKWFSRAFVSFFNICSHMSSHQTQTLVFFLLLSPQNMFGGGNRDLYDDGSGYGGGGGGGAGGAGVGPGGTGGAFNQGRATLFQRHISVLTHE